MRLESVKVLTSEKFDGRLLIRNKGRKGLEKVKVVEMKGE